MPNVPATVGIKGLIGPMKRPKAMLNAPYFSKNLMPLLSHKGCLAKILTL